MEGVDELPATAAEAFAALGANWAVLAGLSYGTLGLTGSLAAADVAGAAR
jgi:hypothetical protein